MTQCSNFIFSLGDEFMRNIALKSGSHDGFHDWWVIDFLVLIQIVSSWISSGMVMAEVLVAVSNGANDIPLVDLHVVDIEKEFEVVASDTLTQFDAPGRFVTHIIFVIYAAVEEFHGDGHPIFFGKA
jgi:hypothetical protein